ncbi:ArsR family transcriptional regulator [Aestuariicoccus sp. MJ-SS9]|uniref:ArsR family transcriptional regulator n=1 Tax=Aestuariicoccus sp. MJ-SS9 TaxID=3079855 RepID=UPI0039777DFD
MELAARMGTDNKVVSRHLAKLEQAGLIRYGGQHQANESHVTKWAINLEAIFALPPVRGNRERTKLIDKIKVESSGKTRGGREPSPRGVESHSPRY